MNGIKDTIIKLLRLDNLVENISGYVETRVQLLKIEIKEDVVKVLAKGLVQGILFFAALLFLFFISVGLAQYLNTFFINSFEGYLIVSGGYFLVFIVLIIFRKNIDKKFEQYFSNILKQEKD